MNLWDYSSSEPYKLFVKAFLEYKRIGVEHSLTFKCTGAVKEELIAKEDSQDTNWQCFQIYKKEHNITAA